MTPVAAERSRSPSFDQYVIRCCAESNPSSRGTNSSPLEHLSLFLFEQNLLRSAPESESLIPDFLLGFASVDVSTLTPPEGAREPLHRAYMLDLKLLEDPTRPATLAVDVRVWGRSTYSSLCAGVFLESSSYKYDGHVENGGGPAFLFEKTGLQMSYCYRHEWSEGRGKVADCPSEILLLILSCSS